MKEEKPEEVPGVDGVGADEPSMSTLDRAANRTKEAQAASAEADDPDQTAVEYDMVEEPASSKWYNQLPEDSMSEEPN